jgi:methylated-DNA-[protein]-cysteine S-methyltransferase
MNPNEPPRPAKHARPGAQARTDTPLGPVTLVATADGLAGVWFDGQAHHPGPLDVALDPGQVHIAQAVRELGEYFRGRRTRFDVALDPLGTDFQHGVWTALARIAHGRTTSYGEIALRLGRAAAVRAVGAAVGRNPLSVIVPCHRVLGRDGSLTGYAGGLARKEALLRLEGAGSP